MAVGTKTTEFTLATSMADSDEFLANIGSKSSRIAKNSIPELAGEIVFLLGGDSIVLNETEHYRRLINMNNTAGDVTVTIPEHATVDKYGLFCTLVGGSGANDLIVSAAGTGELRARGQIPLLATNGDTVYLGASRALGDETIANIYRRGGIWTIDCNTGIRTTADGDEGPGPLATAALVTAALTDNELTEVSGDTYEITDGDHLTPIWLTNAGPVTLTVQTDIEAGIQVTIINGGSNAASLNVGTHTLSGDSSIAAGQGASFLTGPTVSGDNRNIFVAASS